MLTLFTWGVDPGKMCEVRVSGGTDDLAANLAEIISALRERDDLSGAYKSAVDKTIDIM